MTTALAEFITCMNKIVIHKEPVSQAADTARLLEIMLTEPQFLEARRHHRARH